MFRKKLYWLKSEVLTRHQSALIGLIQSNLRFL